MADLIKYAVGIDVSKDKFDACFGEMDIRQQFEAKGKREFANNDKGFKELEQWMAKQQKQKLFLIVSMEATGVYYERLAFHLNRQQFNVAIVLPNKARKYMQSLGFKSKNDKIDARGLAKMAAEQNLELWQPMGEYFYSLRMLTRHHEQLHQSRTVFNNQLHACEHSAMQEKLVLKQLHQAIDLMDKQLEQTVNNIQKHINTSEEVKRKVENICGIKGVGLLSVATVIAETNGFTLFKSIPQLVSYAGYDVIENQSGNHVGKTRISKKGNSHIRRILHMPSFCVITYKQKPFIDLFNRVYEKTGIKMKAYVAVQKKILEIMYTLWKKNEAFKNEFKNTSGNDEHSAFFPLPNNVNVTSDYKIVVSQLSDTTQDELRYNESHEALFP
jgi:transposase